MVGCPRQGLLAPAWRHAASLPRFATFMATSPSPAPVTCSSIEIGFEFTKQSSASKELFTTTARCVPALLG